MAQSTKDLPSFIVYQPNAKTFHICLEAGSVYYVWSGIYPPTRDNRFARSITRQKDMAQKEIPQKKVYDKGTYTVNKGDDKAAAEKKLRAGTSKQSFSFIFYGKRLKGRFIIKQTAAGTVIQKFKDSFATEENVLSEDLGRTISLMIPDYDPDSIKLPSPQKEKRPAAVKKDKPANAASRHSAEQPTADKRIGNTGYHFAFYHSDAGPDLCVVTNDRNEVLVLQKHKDHWQLLKAAKGAVLKKADALASHVRALRRIQDPS
ncbi:hypothetical protein [Niabella sp.]|uniref:hypothetical protein n=1 Tax=Niabella sp. TaxID=1962976 RepID=UPI00261E177A|nr:hypothetical protein [Niabella sp.]